MSKFPRAILFSALFLASTLTVFAQGAIDVKMTKMDKAIPMPLILGLALAALVFAGVVYMIISRPRNNAEQVKPMPKTVAPERIEPKTSISMKQQTEPVKDEQYYRSIFDRKDDVKIIDEKPEPVPKKKVKVQKPAQDSQDIKIENYLKEDERIVINIIKMKNNSCSQATIQVVSNFSKAHLSRILAELTERGVVFKERRGRKNIITLNT